MTTAATVRSRLMSPESATQTPGWAQQREVLLDAGAGRSSAKPARPASQALSRCSEELRAKTLSSSAAAKSGCRKWLVCADCPAAAVTRIWSSRISTQARLAGSHSVSERELASGSSARMSSASATLPAVSSRCLIARYGGRPGCQVPPSTRFRPMARPSLLMPR